MLPELKVVRPMRASVARPTVRLAAPNFGTVVSLLALVPVMYLLWIYCRHLGLIVASDDLMFQSLMNDLRSGNYRFSDLAWGKNLYIFPDMPLFLLIDFLFTDVMKTYAAYPMMTVGIFVGFGGLIARQLATSVPLIRFGLLASALLLLSVVSQPQSHTIYVLRPGWHGGAIIAGLLYAWITARVLTTQRFSLHLLAAFFVAFLSTPSDKLFAVQFLAPVCAALWWMGLRGLVSFRRVLLFTIGSGLGMVAGMAGQVWLRKQGIFVSQEDPWPTYAQAIASLKQFWVDLPALFALYPYTLLLSVLSMVLLVHRAYKQLTEHEEKPLVATEFYAILTPVALLAALLAPAVLGVWTGLFSQRFLMSWYVIPPLMIAAAISTYPIPRWSHPAALGRIALVGLSIVAAFATLPVKHILSQPLSLTRHPEVVLLEEMRAKHQLKNGFAFWEAKRLTLGTKTPYRVNSMEGESYLGGWYVNLGWSLTERRPDLGNGIPEYNFLLIRHPAGDPNAAIKTTRLKALCGEPAHVETRGEFEFLIYNRPSDVAFRNFTRLPALQMAKRPLPPSVVDAPHLAIYKSYGHMGDGSRWACGETCPGGLVLKLAEPSPARGYVLELALDDNAAYQIDLHSNGEVVSRIPVSPGGNGTHLRTLYLPMVNSLNSGTIDHIVIHGNTREKQRVGHLFTYPDSPPVGQ
ncbi:MAG: hypothetical protein ACRCZF_01980 [Gemmataceae bacterium]